MSEMTYEDSVLQQLVDEDYLTPEQAEEVIDEHQRTGKSIKLVLVDMQVLSEDDVLNDVAQQMGVPLVDLSDVEVPPEILHSVPVSVPRMYNVFPVEADGQSVVLATFDIIAPEMVDEITFVLSRDVSFVVAREPEIKELITKYYGDDSDSMETMLSELGHELESSEILEAVQREDLVEDLEHAANLAPVVRFVNLVLYQGVKDRASDIHFEPFEHEFKIRYRVDGALYEMAPPPKHLALPVISRIKVISGLNIAERRIPQDGRIQLNIGGKYVDFRVSTLPTQFGESVVLRILDQSAVQLDLENLGLPDDIFQSFVDDLQKPNGIIIVTGPTGSGKTTTLYSGLKRLNTVETKILTAEDPVEYDIDGIIQVPVNDAIGVTFVRVLRAFLRQDPDVIMVGEIRDLDTAQIAIQASMTGHLVFSTLHTNDAPGAVTRLIDMNVEPFLIASTLQTILGQRLARRICVHCKTPYTPDEQTLQSLGLRREDIGAQPFYFGEGCSHCSNTGYRGRKGIYEYLKITDPIRNLINDRKPSMVIAERAKELGMRDLREDGIRGILDGHTTVEEVLKYT
ncbi:MAG: pilus assembly protein PilB [Spartobacteria bacterium]|nr:pilus assembly protein PilB [Spartobacteria bacterium]